MKIHFASYAASLFVQCSNEIYCHNLSLCSRVPRFGQIEGNFKCSRF